MALRVIVSLSILCKLLSAQEIPDSTERSDSENNYFENFQETIPTSVAEEWEELRRNPIDLNTADIEAFEKIPNLSPLLAKAIIEYRRQRKFETSRDLLNVSSMTRAVFLKIRDYVAVYDATRRKTFDGEFRARIERTLEIPENFSKYEGNIYQVYQRAQGEYRPPWFRFPESTIRGALVIEKDPGERELHDHAAGFVAIEHVGYLRRLIVGNYLLEYGQGLALLGGTALSKGTEVISSVKRSGRGPVPFRSATENQAQQGVALDIDLPIKGFRASGFYSYAHYDASFNSDGTVNSILTDGFHRDSTEFRRQNYLGESLGGGSLQYAWNSSRVGVLFYANQYSRQFVVRDTIRQRYNYQGHHSNMTSVYHDIFLGDLNLFGEIARDLNGRNALNSGVLGEWPKLDVAIFYRNYPKNFQSRHGQAFGDQSGPPQNEQGLYTGIKLKPRRGTTVQFYLDHYVYPWRSYSTPEPTRGRDFLGQAEQALGNSQFLIAYKNESRSAAVATKDALGRDITVVEPAITQRARFQWEMALTGNMIARTRLEQAYYRIQDFPGSQDQGILVYQNLKWRVEKNWTLQARMTFFDTDPNAPLYEYENDVEGVFTTTRFSGKGVRWYFLTSYRLNSHLEGSLKYSHLVRANQNISAEISGHVLQRLTINIDVKY